ncbi:MAG TPA: DUF1775 domain-containing protein [Terriglobia bacterium]|nr:DUF1775 domain-containing protein [Terriglobia bacterium]
MKRFLLLTTISLVVTQAALAHIRIYPNESSAGAREKYTMRVPNEKKAANAIRVEGEFPAGLEVYDFEFKPGWKIDFKKDDKGKIVGATWTGKIQPYEFVEFGMLGINPKQGANLTWKFIQFYDDGTKEEFVGPVGSRLPAPVVALKPATP